MAEYHRGAALEDTRAFAKRRAANDRPYGQGAGVRPGNPEAAAKRRAADDRPYGEERTGRAADDRPYEEERTGRTIHDRPYGEERTGRAADDRPYEEERTGRAVDDRPYGRGAGVRPGNPEAAAGRRAVDDRHYEEERSGRAANDRPYEEERSGRAANDRPYEEVRSGRAANDRPYGEGINVNLENPRAPAVPKRPAAAAVSESPGAAAVSESPGAATVPESPGAAAVSESPGAAAVAENPEAAAERRLARHEAEARKSNPTLYDLQGNFVYWLDWLSRDRSGAVEKSLSNLCVVLETDPQLANLGYNQFSGSLEATGPLPWREEPGPWRDTDSAQLMRYVDSRYASFPLSFYNQALAAQEDRIGFHPIRSYLMGLPAWDGRPRVETLLVDYLGAQDTPYVRAVTRKTLCAAVHRVILPGCKFDNILVLSGPQGVGKSTLLARLGMGWFSDSLSVSDMNDKTAAELLQGHWLIEIGEMAGMKKAELEKVKAFLTRQDDKYRATYGQRVNSHPRQCVFFGTTNQEGYLRDLTGNRRFWTVQVTGQGKHKPWELEQPVLDQIWAEVLTLAVTEQLYLEPELEAQAAAVQRDALEQDDREGLVRAYLEEPIPPDWDGRSLGERMSWYQTPTLARGGEKKLVRRRQTSNMEIWCECFGEPRQRLTRKDSFAISAIMARIPGWERLPKAVRRGPYGPQMIYQSAPKAKPEGNSLSQAL